MDNKFLTPQNYKLVTPRALLETGKNLEGAMTPEEFDSNGAKRREKGKWFTKRNLARLGASTLAATGITLALIETPDSRDSSVLQTGHLAPAPASFNAEQAEKATLAYTDKTGDSQTVHVLRPGPDQTQTP